MITRILIYIKHNIPLIWSLIEKCNDLLFKLLHRKKFLKVAENVFNTFALPGYNFRNLQESDIPQLEILLNKQPASRLEFFNPHKFDGKSLLLVFKNPSFLMMGAFNESILVGYFFLRCFWNRRCFVGRLIDKPYEGKGIGRVMNNIMYNIGWQMNFRVMSTISKNNHQVMRSHANNPAMVLLKELDNDYILVEFVKEAKGSGYVAQSTVNRKKYDRGPASSLKS